MSILRPAGRGGSLVAALATLAFLTRPVAAHAEPPAPVRAAVQAAAEPTAAPAPAPSGEATSGVPPSTNAPAAGTGLVATAAAGTVRASDGTSVAGATVVLGGNGPVRTTRSDRSGHFRLDGLRPGTYVLEVRAPGYTALSGRTVQIASGNVITLDVALPRAQVSSLATIGSVTANGSRALSTSPAPTLDISAQPYAQQGVTRVSDILGDELSTTVYPILGGGLNAPAVVALRGPDPSETLVDVDGHQVNNGSTGDFDLSLLDPADLQSIQVVYGIAPSALYGPNTLGGALNVRTLEPTTQPQTTLRFSGGSYDTFGETLNSTGTTGRLGYALSYHRETSGGELDDFLIPTTSGNGVAPISNALDATTLLGKLRYAFPSGGFVGLTFSDQAVFRDLSATLSSVQTPANGAPGGVNAYDNFSGTTLDSTNVAYGFDAEIPLGPRDADGSQLTTAILRHQLSTVAQSVAGPGIGTSPYLYNDHDRIVDDTLEIDHILPHGLLSIKYAITNEGLLTDFIPGVIYADAVARTPVAGDTPDAIARTAAEAIPDVTGSTTQFLAQTERSLGVLYQVEPTAKLHYSFAAYDSDYSSFGRSIDPRFGFSWTPTARSGYRVSAGSTFQSPQLPALLVPPVLPPPVDGYVSIGNAHLTAERATSYDIGADHIFAAHAYPLTLSLDLYRTDLHNGVATYFSPAQCADGVDYGATPPCLSYPVNATREVYQGVELRAARSLARTTTLRASYDIDSVFTKSVPPAAVDDVPLFEQSLGVPLHKATLDIAHDAATGGVAYYAGVLYEGAYNELNLPPYATLRAGITWHVRKDLDLGLYGTNLTGVYDFKLTQLGGGVPYGGVPSPTPTDALPLAGRQITFTAALHLR